MGDLPLRFQEFMSYWDGSENIDSTLAKNDFQGLQRADYMLFDRRVIVEQKILESEPTDNLQNFMTEICLERGIGVFGTVPVGKVLEKLPDRDEVEFKLWNRLNARVEKLFSTADKQIRDSKFIFQNNDAIGLLVVLNENVALISPKGAALKFNGMFLKNEDDGTARYKHVDAALIISEAHYVDGRAGKMAPFITVYSHRSHNGEAASKTAYDICQAWSWYNGYPVEERNFEDLDLKFFARRQIGLPL